MKNCKNCKKLITYTHKMGVCETNGTVPLIGCDNFESRPIKLPIHDFKACTSLQLDKVAEEHHEVIQAYQNESNSRVIEECCDLIQATVNLIEMLSPTGVHEALTRHSAKMQERNYPVKYELEVR